MADPKVFVNKFCIEKGEKDTIRIYIHDPVDVIYGYLVESNKGRWFAGNTTYTIAQELLKIYEKKLKEKEIEYANRSKEKLSFTPILKINAEGTSTPTSTSCIGKSQLECIDAGGVCAWNPLLKDTNRCTATRRAA